MYYIKECCNKDINNCISILEKFKSKKFIDNKYYENKYHLLVVFSIKEYNDKVITNKIKNRQKNLEFTFNVNKESINVYNTLNEKRLYSISDDIGCFHLGTNENNFDKFEAIYNWEFYCQNTPLWHDRLTKYKYIFENKSIVFKDEDDLENFYDKYNYEPDEKLLLFFKKIHDSTIEDWLNTIYDTSFENLYKSKIHY